jgi:predicted nucleic-acid-binding protein
VIGLDANALLGLLEHEHSPRGQAAKTLLKQAQNDGGGYIHPLALGKLGDALEKIVGGRARVADYLAFILNAPEFTVGAEKAAREALKRYRDGTASFSDCLLAALNRAAGCQNTFIGTGHPQNFAGFAKFEG